jgi:hypothetical protein
MSFLYDVLEPYVMKVTSTVLRGGGIRESSFLPDFQEGKRMSNDLMDVMMGGENESIGKKEQERNVVTVRVRDRNTFFSMISDVSKVCATSDAISVLQMIKMSIIYSASGSWTDDYCLGILSTKMGSDLLNPSSWKKHDKPVFSKTDKVFGPGHSSFVKSVGKEDWILYHAAKMQGSGWNRNVRMQSFKWNADGTPNFGTPIAEDVQINVPSGE